MKQLFFDMVQKLPYIFLLEGIVFLLRNTVCYTFTISQELPDVLEVWHMGHKFCCQLVSEVGFNLKKALKFGKNRWSY